VLPAFRSSPLTRKCPSWVIFAHAGVGLCETACPSTPEIGRSPADYAVRHKRSIVVSMAEGTFCTGHAEIRLIQIRIQAAFRGD
jgi:hypothetical protein